MLRSEAITNLWNIMKTEYKADAHSQPFQNVVKEFEDFLDNVYGIRPNKVEQCQHRVLMHYSVNKEQIKGLKVEGDLKKQKTVCKVERRSDDKDLSFIIALDYKKNASNAQYSAAHLQGPDPNDPALHSLREEIDFLKVALARTNGIATDTIFYVPAVKCPEYRLSRHVEYILLGAGAEIGFIMYPTYGCKVKGTFAGVKFCVRVYTKISGAFNTDASKKKWVWEPDSLEGNTDIRLLSGALKSSIDALMHLQRNQVLMEAPSGSQLSRYVGDVTARVDAVAITE
jgi:hypothetical protein